MGKSRVKVAAPAVEKAATSGGWWAWLLAGLTGGLLALAYPGGGLWPIAFIAYAPLLWALNDVERIKRGFVLGLVAGTVLHGLSFHWLSFTMHEMSGLPAAVGWLVVAGHAAAMGLHQAVFAAALVALRRWRRSPLWFVWVGASLMMAEVVVPWQFPWYLGNTVYLAPIWLQPADLFGIVGVSGLLVACSALLVAALRRRSLRHALGLAGLLLVWLGYGGLRQSMIDGAAPKKRWKVGVVQHNPTIKEKKALKPHVRLPMLKRVMSLTKALPLKDLDLVVWSEGALPFFYVPLELEKPVRAPPVLRKMTRDVHLLAEGLGRPLIFGTLRMTDKRWKERARNTAVLVDGTSYSTYDKHVLVPFGEFLPGRDLIPTLKDLIPGVSDLYEGSGPTIMRVRDVKVGMSICYEALFSMFMWRNNADSDLLINLTDDVWFGPTNAPELHLMVQLPRAVELRRPLLRATATGVSALVDATGRIHGRTPVWKATSRVVNVEMRDLDSPFRLWGPWPSWLLALGVLGAVGWCWREERGQQTANS